ncbi:TIGR03943 family putative permease subunit [Streptococcus sp. DD12]|uniref:TIGR03943 family putative permease subunit n=1 Tax=Streptococcus sp. DD12 TaxID=1777880 RepID=UPI0007971FFD|nr:TIGR03943 family protein [Streptococcus sp. DD12]KXT76886.1 ABC transporter, substrate-binding protein [Streptococcus sp. DD12]
MRRFLILAGYFELTMYLQLTGKLNQYINSHYTYLAYLSMFFAFLLALVQLTIWMKQLHWHSHLSSWQARLSSMVLLALPVFIGLLVPTVTLDATTVSAKGYHFPLAAGSTGGTSQDGTTVQYLKPDTSSYFTKSAYSTEMAKELAKYQKAQSITITSDNYMEIMELIYQFPQEFIGKTVTYTGFIYNDPKVKNYQFAFRFGIIHCIADSGVYGLATTGNTTHYADNTWVTMTGTITQEYHQSLKENIPVLHITDCKTVSQPKNPYVYRVF